MMNQRAQGLEVCGTAWGIKAKIELERILLNAKTVPRHGGNRGTKAKITYSTILSAFDIETTTLREIKQAFMYVWQWAFMDQESGEILALYGRTWDEWRECALMIRDTLPGGVTMVVLDHNLSFEFQFLAEYINFSLDDVFATDKREVVKCRAFDCLEYRCTLRHSNASLATYTKQWHVAHQKLSGEDFGYTAIRYPWTPLTEDQLHYAINDVVGLLEAYTAEMEYWHDDLYTVPMTSTGYVRRICKRAWATLNFYDRLSWLPDLETLDLLHEAFRGGDTHASRYHSTPEGCDPVIYKVQSWDRSSSYPDVLVNCRYPLGDWYRLGKRGEWLSVADIERYIYKYEKAVLCRVHFRGLRLKNPRWAMPYIPKSKAGYYDNIQEDNGRVLAADFLSMSITDVDWIIIKKEYAWDDVFFSDARYCRYRPLPPVFCDVVKQFFRDKTQLKGAEEGSQEEIEYCLKKALLNALYGMCAQWPVKENLLYINGQFVNQIDQEIEEQGLRTEKEKREYRKKRRAEILDKHNKKAFVPYTIGVWCTAWARLELHRSIWAVEDYGGRTVYVDTDSNKFIGDIDLSELNAYYRERSEKSGAFADDRKGKRHYMGVYEYEYTADFATMGAKKYVYKREGEEHLHITIAGVGKKAGAAYLEKMGGLSAFKSGLVFDGDNGGGLCGVYNDTPFGTIEAEGHALYIGKNLCLMPDTYTLGLSGDYARLLDEIAVYGAITGKCLGVGLE